MYQENSASTSFSDMFNDENTSDFTIKCQDKYFYVHQLILKRNGELVLFLRSLGMFGNCLVNPLTKNCFINE